MTDRDHIAAMAMQAVLSQQRPATCPRCSGYDKESAHKMLAKVAYAIADAMMAARNAPVPQPCRFCGDGTDPDCHHAPPFESKP